MKNFYFTFCCITILTLVFSDYFNEISEVRKQYIVLSKNQEKETIVLSKSAWKSFSNKNEIFFNHNYYDVFSVKIINQKVFLKVYHDTFEIILKALQKNLTQKNKLKIKKTIDLYFHNLRLTVYLNLSFYNKISVLKISFIYKNITSSLLRPPILN